MKSLSEIETISKRASKAAGFEWGIAEEVGKNIRILENFSLSGIKNLNDFLKKKKEQNFENLKLIKKENIAGKLEFCPIVSGTSFLDQVKSLDQINEIIFHKMAYPLLFLPFISRASEIIGKRILLEFDDIQFLLNFNNSIFSNFKSKKIIDISNILSVKFIDNIDIFSEKDWKELYKLSENTFVDENESLKYGAAGAGLTDND